MIFRVQEVVEVWCSQHRSAPNFDDLLHSEYHSISKWKLPLESVEKVVSKSECRKLFQLGLNYHTALPPDNKMFATPLLSVRMRFCLQKFGVAAVFYSYKLCPFAILTTLYRIYQEKAKNTKC